MISDKIDYRLLRSLAVKKLHFPTNTNSAIPRTNKNQELLINEIQTRYKPSFRRKLDN